MTSEPDLPANSAVTVPMPVAPKPVEPAAGSAPEVGSEGQSESPPTAPLVVRGPEPTPAIDTAIDTAKEPEPEPESESESESLEPEQLDAEPAPEPSSDPAFASESLPAEEAPISASLIGLLGESVPVAGSVSVDEPVPAGELVPVDEPVPAGELVPVDESVPAGESVLTVESEATSISDPAPEPPTNPIPDRGDQSIINRGRPGLRSRVVRPAIKRQPPGEFSSGPPPESVTSPVAEPVTYPVAEPVTYPVAEPVTYPVAEPVTNPVTEPVTEPVSSPVSVRDPVAEHSDELGSRFPAERPPIREPEAAPEPVLDPVSSTPEPSPVVPATRSTRTRAGAIGTAMVLVAAGLLFTTSATTARGTQLRPERADLADLIAAEDLRVKNRTQRVATLNKQVQKEAAANTVNSKAIEVLEEGSAKVSGAAGLLPMTGPGLTVTLDDAPRDVPVPAQAGPDDLVVHQQDVQAVVNALWAGGAEAMMLQDQRVISTSAVRCVGNTLILQGRVYSPPYKITVIGDVQGMQAAIDSSPQIAYYLQYVASLRLGWSVKRSDRLSLSAYAGSLVLSHARAAGSAEASSSGPTSSSP